MSQPTCFMEHLMLVKISTTQKSFESSSQSVSQQVAKHNIPGPQSIVTMTF